MDWDELESVLWQYYQGLPEPKISFESWWYSDGGIMEMLQTYHIPEKKEITERPLWARRG